MPVVPFVQRPPGQALPGPPPDDQWTLMAAAQMHSEGRLIERTSFEWSDKNVTGGLVTDNSMNDMTDNDVSNLFSNRNEDIIDNNGVTFSKKAYDKFKATIDSLGPDYENIPSADGKHIHVRRMPKVF
jgi:hypothetical protein